MIVSLFPWYPLVLYCAPHPTPPPHCILDAEQLFRRFSHFYPHSAKLKGSNIIYFYLLNPLKSQTQYFDLQYTGRAKILYIVNWVLKFKSRTTCQNSVSNVNSWAYIWLSKLIHLNFIVSFSLVSFIPFNTHTTLMVLTVCTNGNCFNW